MKPMPPPDMPPSIQKPQNWAPNAAAHPADQLLGVEVAGPGNDGLDRAEEVARGGLADALDIAGAQRRHHLVQHGAGLLPAIPFGFGAQQILFGDHLQDGADVLRHAAVDQDQAVLQRLAGLRLSLRPGRRCDGWAANARG